MILIFSNNDDHSTNDVIDWLLSWNAPFERANEDTRVDLLAYSIDDKGVRYRIRVNERVLDSSDITAIWFRRGGLWLHAEQVTLPPEHEAFSAFINDQLAEDTHSVRQALLSHQRGLSLNSEALANVNKLEVLSQAAAVGLKVPCTLVTSCRSEALKFARQYGSVANKNISPGVIPARGAFRAEGCTVRLQARDMEDLPDSFGPFLFQQYLEKYVELRIFYLDGECFASAIFSQQDERTQVDFRNYNYETPNRTPPFLLPLGVQDKVRALMRLLGLNCGSIDMILTPSLEYFFLEVNPVGLFWQVSHPCNYGLEKQIALWLTHGGARD